MNSNRHLSDFEMGVMAAMTLIGTSLATLDPTLRDKIRDSAQTLIGALPDDKSLADGTSAHHAALKALISGLYPEKSRKSAE